MPRSSLLLIGCFLLCFTATPAYPQQQSVRVEFAADTSRVFAVETFIRSSVEYGSVNQLANALALPFHEDSRHGRAELTIGTIGIGLVADNPFVGMTDKAGMAGARQLSTPVLVVQGAYYAPLLDLISIITPLYAIPLRFDHARNLLLVGLPPSLPKFDLSEVTLESKANGMIIHVHVAHPVKNIERWIKPDGWLYVTLPGIVGNVASLNATPANGIVKKVVANQSPGSLQLSFRLSQPATSTEIAPGTEGEVALVVRTTTTLPKTTSETASRNESSRERWAMDVVVIDAGHGGKDGGAIGVTGVLEKRVTLGVALKLGAQIKRNIPGVRVVYTRNDDQFPELDRRGRIANEADGKLFISIHCNSLKKKPSPTRGFEVYLLRPGRTEEAIAIAERENAVIQLEEGYEERYKHLQDENFILTSMARSAHVRASEVFADLVQQEMENHTSLSNRGVKQAGFYVLVGASMPNILVETAYLSNKEDERYLKSESGQEKIAESLCIAVKRYKAEYEKLLGGE